MKRSAVYRYPRTGIRPAEAAVGAGALCLLPACAGAALSAFGWLPHDPTAFVAPPHAPPSPSLWLGADALGRDLAARLAAAAAGLALPGLAAVAAAVGLGAFLGLAEGLAPRPFRSLATWLVESVDSIPKLVTALLVAAAAGNRPVWTMTALGAAFAPQMAECIRSSVEELRSRTFIEAERCLGVNPLRIAVVHILWAHARSVLLAQVSALLSYVVLVEASLSYLGGGLGVQEPVPSWGNMLALARDGLFQGHWMPAVAPAVVLSLTLLGFTLVGRGLLASAEERA